MIVDDGGALGTTQSRPGVHASVPEDETLGAVRIEPGDDLDDRTVHAGHLVGGRDLPRAIERSRVADVDFLARRKRRRVDAGPATRPDELHAHVLGAARSAQPVRALREERAPFGHVDPGGEQRDPDGAQGLVLCREPLRVSLSRDPEAVGDFSPGVMRDVPPGYRPEEPASVVLLPLRDQRAEVAHRDLDDVVACVHDAGVAGELTTAAVVARALGPVGLVDRDGGGASPGAPDDDGRGDDPLHAPAVVDPAPVGGSQMAILLYLPLEAADQDVRLVGAVGRSTGLRGLVRRIIRRAAVGAAEVEGEKGDHEDHPPTHPVLSRRLQTHHEIEHSFGFKERTLSSFRVNAESALRTERS